MNKLATAVIAKWDATTVDAVKTPDGQEWARGDYFNEAIRDILALTAELQKVSGAKRNAERKARKARRKLEGPSGDTSAKGVAEQGLNRSVGPNARSDSTRRTQQSQSVSGPLAVADEATGRVAVGQTSGSSDIADANGSADVEGRQSLHPITSKAAS